MYIIIQIFNQFISLACRMWDDLQTFSPSEADGYNMLDDPNSLRRT